MNKCYWYNQYYIIDKQKYFLNFSDSFSYCNKQTTKLEINTFDELFKMAFENRIPRCKYGVTKFSLKKYVNIHYAWPCDNEMFHITEEKFTPIIFVDEYREFTPTVEQAMKYLTIEQFKEYAGFSKESINEKIYS